MATLSEDLYHADGRGDAAVVVNRWLLMEMKMIKKTDFRASPKCAPLYLK